MKNNRNIIQWGATYQQTNDTYNTYIELHCVGQYNAMPYTQTMHVEWKIVTGNTQVTRKLTEFVKMCGACNTRLKLVLQTLVMVVTLLAEQCLIS